MSMGHAANDAKPLTYRERADRAAALAYVETARPAWQARGGPAKVGSAYRSLVRTHRSLGRREAALAIERRLARQAGAAGEPDGFEYAERGAILWAKGEAGVPRPNVVRGYALLSGSQAQAPECLGRRKRLGSGA